MTPRIVALGDSTSCGEGVGFSLPSGSTWPARVAAATPGAELVPLAVAGSRLRDLRTSQLPTALASGADVVTVLIGLNDVARSGFDAAEFRRSLADVIGALRSSASVVIVGRLHDVTAVLPLPPALRHAVRSRTAAVNAAVDSCLDDRVLALDLAALHGMRMRRMWEVDRLHPNVAGHALIAAEAARVLRTTGLHVGPVRQPGMPSPPGRLQEARWLVRHGLPWLGSHVPQVVLPALVATARPARSG